MRRFQLIKKYPGCLDIGTIVYSPHRERAYLNDEGSMYKERNTRNVKNYIFYSKNDIETFPKFWKEI